MSTSDHFSMFLPVCNQTQSTSKTVRWVLHHFLYAAWFPSALYWWLLIKIYWPFVKPYNVLICCYIMTKKLLIMIASHYRYIRTSNCNRNTGSALGIRIGCLTMTGFFSLFYLLSNNIYLIMKINDIET